LNLLWRERGKVVAIIEIVSPGNIEANYKNLVGDKIMPHRRDHVTDVASRIKSLKRMLGFMSALLVGLGFPPTIKAHDWGYDTLVEPLPRPAWLEKVAVLCEIPWTNRERKTLKPHVQRLRDAGFSVAVMHSDGLCQLHTPDATERWPAECHAEVKASHAAGIKVLAGIYPFVGSRGARDLLTSHPEWRSRKDDQTPDAPGDGCLISPFGDALIDLLTARLKEYDIDGYQFDGWYQLTYCRCPGCLKGYKVETGRAVPSKVDLSDPDYRKYLVWRDARLMQVFLKLRQSIKSVKPEAVLINWNNNDVAASAPSWMPESLNCLNDWTNKEWWDSNDLASVWLIKRLRGAAGDRPAGVQPYMFLRHGHDVASGVYHGSSCPIEEVLYRMHKVLAMGSIPIIWPGARQAWTDADSDKVTQGLIDFLPLVHETQTLKYAAVLDSYTSLQMGPPGSKETGPLAHRGGMARALVESHIPFDVISEHNASRELFNKYRVVILANTTCLSDRLVSSLREYVASGGGLIATFESSLYDKWGNARPDFALADLFGASYSGKTKTAGPSRIRFARAPSPVSDDAIVKGLKELMGDRGNTTYWGRFVRVTVAESGDATTNSPLSAAEILKGEKESPARWTPLLLVQRERGRVAYFPAAIDDAYWEAGYPYQRLLIRNAIRWAAGGEPLVEVTAPLCVSAGFFTKALGKTQQTIVHLLNDIDSTTGHGSKEEKQFAIREEVIPIPGVKVAFSGPRPSRVRLVPGDAPLEAHSKGQAWEVIVPQLDLHAAVVAEYDN
jgi:Glycosyl hydrolase-like 10/Beta-galactosidase trimerisation domain